MREITAIDQKLEQYRKDYKTATPAIKKCILISAKLLKDKKERLIQKEENNYIGVY